MASIKLLFKIILSSIMATLLVISIVVYMQYHIDISKYQGDGEIHKIGAAFFDNGYIINFDKIQLKNMLDKYYIVNKVPSTFKSGQVILIIEFSDSDKILVDSIVVSISAKNIQGKVLFDINKKRISEFNQYIDSYHTCGVSYYYFDSNCHSLLSSKDIKDGGYILKCNVDYFPHKLSDKNIVAYLQVTVGGFF